MYRTISYNLLQYWLLDSSDVKVESRKDVESLAKTKNLTPLSFSSPIQSTSAFRLIKKSRKKIFVR